MSTLTLDEDVDSVNTYRQNVGIVRNTASTSTTTAAGTAQGRRRTPRTARDTYHHGHLPQAMLREAVRIIQRHGVEALTLRGVGARVGVSRTALYRHFANKDALLAAVAAEGFRLLRRELQDAWTSHGEGRLGFEAMGHAYVRFAIRHPSHYRVMFGGALREANAALPPDPGGAGDAFGTLVDALVAQQRSGLVRNDDPVQLARYVWAVVHGVAMLAIDGVLCTPADVERLTGLAIERLRTGIGIHQVDGD